MTGPTGESENAPLRLDFGGRLKLEFDGSKFTSDSVLWPYRDLDLTLQDPVSGMSIERVQVP